MKIWLLEPVAGLPDKAMLSPWVPWCDKCFMMVVIAPTEQEARELAQGMACDEGKKSALWAAPPTATPWLDADFSTCVEVTLDKPRVVVQEVRYG